jgi:hypothetical protein
MERLDCRYIEADPYSGDRLTRRETPVPVEEMARRKLDTWGTAEALESCRLSIEQSRDDGQASYWKQVHAIIASQAESAPPKWLPPFPADEMAADLLSTESFEEALKMIRSEIRTAREPERVRYFRQVEALLFKRALREHEKQTLLL